MDTTHETPPVGDEELRAETVAEDVNEVVASDDSQCRNQALTKAAERRRKERHRAVALAREFRFRDVSELEVRRDAQADTDIITIRGSAIVYDAPYVVRDMFGEFEETMRPGCVSDVLSRGVDCRYLHNHDGMALARTKAGTLDLLDTGRSLDIVARLDARQQLANDLAIAIERGDENQMSVGMVVGRDSWGDDGKMETRDVHELADLLDVSQVTYPCSPTTHLEVAHRMAFAMPLETRARLRQMEVELRAGKVLSADSQSKLVSALSALHDLASSGGVDISGVGSDAEMEPDVNVSPDGSTGGTDDAESGAGADGFPLDQTRSAEPGEPIQYLAKAAIDQAWLDTLVERGESLHGSARKRIA